MKNKKISRCLSGVGMVARILVAPGIILLACCSGVSQNMTEAAITPTATETTIPVEQNLPTTTTTNGATVTTVPSTAPQTLTATGSPNPAFGWPTMQNGQAAPGNPVQDELDVTPAANGSGINDGQMTEAQANTDFNPQPDIADPVIPTTQSPQLQQRQEAPQDFGPDAQIVTSVVSNANELPEGTLVRTRLQQAINSDDAESGSDFSAYVTDNIEKDGVVVIPALSTVRGRIVHASSGSLLHGGASIYLRPDEIITPDGTRYMLHATTIQTDAKTHTRANSEGMIEDHPSRARSLGTFGTITGLSAGTGLLVGGPIGMAAGASVGAGVGTYHWLMHTRNADLPRDSRVVFILSEPMSINGLQNNAGLQYSQPMSTGMVTYNPVQTPVATTPY